LHLSWFDETNLNQGSLSISVDDDKGGQAPHAKASRRPTSYLAGHIESNESGPAFKISFQPVYNRLSQQARASKV
jgi:hypothetical protein